MCLLFAPVLFVHFLFRFRFIIVREDLIHVFWELNPYAEACRDTSDLFNCTRSLPLAIQRQPSAPLYNPTSARSSTKLPLQKSQDFPCNRYGYEAKKKS